MILYIVLLISSVCAEEITSAVVTNSVSENVVVSANDTSSEEQTGLEAVVPIASNINFVGHLNATGKVNIIGTSEPFFGLPWSIPPIPSARLPPVQEELLVVYDYPGSEYPILDYGIPPIFLPSIDPVHIPPFVPIPYGGQIYEPAVFPTPPYFIEIIEPIPNPGIAQPQFIEIFGAYPPLIGQPQIIEIIEPVYGSHPVLQPHYPGFDLPIQSIYPFMPQPNGEIMIPVLVEFDVSDPQLAQILAESGCIVNDTVKTNTKRATQLVPVTGKINIARQF